LDVQGIPELKQRAHTEGYLAKVHFIHFHYHQLLPLPSWVISLVEENVVIDQARFERTPGFYEEIT
jgi:hypothetical protein